MPLPNNHLNKGKYPQSGEEDLNGSTISDISHISQFIQTNTHNKTNMPWGSKQIVFCAY